jgi:4-amino-4-deoxy-L-arabinose transferase-like glycosyltransferase
LAPSGCSRWLLGGLATDAIATYRLPSLLLTALGVWLVLHLYRPVIGAQAAFIAAVLVAGTPVLVLQAHLAIAESLVFPAMVAAQLSLLRLYTSSENGGARWMAGLFWIAQALSIPLNAFSVPIVSVTTLVALWIWDRRLDWLYHLRASVGLAAVAMAAALWLATSAVVYGELPLRGQTLRGALSALAGSQQMNFPAYPGLFVAFLLLGFVPAQLLLIPAILRHRAIGLTPVARFLLAWMVGYLVYLELLSDKPALYVVQNLFPPAAGLVALAAVKSHVRGDSLRIDAATTAFAVLVGLVAAPAAVYVLHHMVGTDAPLTTWIVAASVSLLLVLAAIAACRSLLGVWLALGVAGVAVLNILVFGVVLPNLHGFWASREIGSTLAVLEQCPDGPIEVIGHREPSLPFALGPRVVTTWPIEVAEASRARGATLVIVEQRWERQLREEFVRRSPQALRRVACASAINVARGCRLSFSFYVAGPSDQATACRSRASDRCPPPSAAPARDLGRDCT